MRENDSGATLKGEENLKKIIQSLIGVWAQIEYAFMVGSMLILGALIMVQIFFRGLGFSGIGWLEEMGRYIFGVATLIGCSIAVDTNSHMSVDTLYNALPTGVSNVLRVFLNLVNTILWGYVAFLSIQWMLKVHRIGTTAASLSSFSMWILWLLISICITTMTIRYVVQIYKSIMIVVHYDSEAERKLTQEEKVDTIVEEAKEW